MGALVWGRHALAALMLVVALMTVVGVLALLLLMLGDTSTAPLAGLLLVTAFPALCVLMLLSGLCLGLSLIGGKGRTAWAFFVGGTICNPAPYMVALWVLSLVLGFGSIGSPHGWIV